MVREISIPGRVIPKTQKMVLDAFLLNIQCSKLPRVCMNGNVKLIPVFTFKVASVSSETMFIQSCQAVGPDRLLFCSKTDSLFCFAQTPFSF